MCIDMLQGEAGVTGYDGRVVTIRYFQAEAHIWAGIFIRLYMVLLYPRFRANTIGRASHQAHWREKSTLTLILDVDLK